MIRVAFSEITNTCKSASQTWKSKDEIFEHINFDFSTSGSLIYKKENYSTENLKFSQLEDHVFPWHACRDHDSFPMTVLALERCAWLWQVYYSLDCRVVIINVLQCFCRSTSAKPADRLCLQKRTFPNLLQTKMNFKNTKLYVLFMN